MLRFYVALLYADNNGLDKYIFNVAHHHVYYFFQYIYIQKETKTGNYITWCWPLYVILFHALELWHKRYICTENQNIILIYFVNLNC